MLYSKNHVMFEDNDSESLVDKVNELEKLLNRQTRENCELNIEVAKLQKEIVELKQKMVDLQCEAELARKANEIKNLFLANMSHEIRTPVTGIIGMGEILSRQNLTPEQAASLTVISQSSRAVLGLINDMMDISRIEAGKMKINNEPFPVKSLLENIRTLSTPMIINKNNQLSIKVSESVPEVVSSDKYRVEQILMNLVNNAIKFTSGGEIEIIAETIPGVPDQIKISVKDTGTGISKENQDKLFRQFQQIDSEIKVENSGAGLGLYICKQLVTLLGGKIGVESSPGVGSTFWFTFCTGVPQTASSNKTEIMQDDDSWDISLDLNVLLVEDKPVNIKVISLMLQTANCNVDTAVNGLEALEKFDPDKHQVVLMDIMMPVMDGVTAMKEIRKKFDNPCPIIAITANAMQGDEEKYIGMGFDAYIAKPVTMSKLTSHLKDLGMITSTN
jgi:signal transduction histidine kinase/CheY-like chemotaxis protein